FAVANLAAAQEVGQEGEALAVPGVEEGTGRGLAVQLRERGGPAAPGIQLGLQRARGPQDAHGVCGRALAEAEDHLRGREGGCRGRGLEPLPEAARAHLDPRAYALSIADAAREVDAQRVVAAAAVVPPDRDLALRSPQHEVEGAVAVQVRSGEGGEGAGHGGLRGLRPLAPAEIAEDLEPARGQQDEVEQAVLVVVEELRGRRGGAGEGRGAEAVVAAAEREGTG